MFKPNLKRHSRCFILPAATVLGLSSAFLSPAFGQDDDVELEEITVTGSRIVRRDFEANSPILTVENEMFDSVSTVGIETALNQLPQFIPAATQFDDDPLSAGVTSTPGASTVSLRGLASNRNLVLLDGRRAMPVNASMAVDINSIPSAAIQRVETITGGASSVYGADAVAGVVNFILKKDFEGADFDLQYSSSELGDGEEARVSALFGANFADGNGNVMFGLEYASRRPVLRRDRDFYRKGWADPTVNGSEFFSTDTSMQFIGGNVPDQAVVDGIFDELPAGTIPPNGQWWFNDDGTVYQGAANFGGVNGNNAGLYRYKGEYIVDGLVKRKIDQQGDLEENQLLSLLSVPLERYSMFSNARYEIKPGLEAFIQGVFSQNQTRTVFQFSPAIGGWSLNIPHGDGIYAPSLGADGNTLGAYQLGGAFGLECGPVGGCTNSEAFPTPPELTLLLDSRADPNGDWQLNKVQDFVPPRVIQNSNRTFQVNAGLNGDIPLLDGTWDFVMSHGNSLTTTRYIGFGSLSRYRAIGESANYGRNFFQQGNQQQGGFSSGIGQCTSGLPFFFDVSLVSQDCLDSMRADMQNISESTQDYFELNAQGRLMDLPAGEARFAIGTGWRRNLYTFIFDPLNTQTSFTDLPLGGFPSDNTEGRISVKEFYGELLLPVISGVTGIEELNLELGYRYSDYSLFGGIDTYKGLVDWSVNDSLRLRGGYQLATRAPNIAELFQAEAQEFYVGAGDLCGLNSQRPNGANPAINPNAADTRALCEALMGPDAAQAFYIDNADNQPNGFVLAGFFNAVGNPNVQPEEATTWTAGLVYQPESNNAFLDGMTLSVDWYSIEIEDMISVEAPVAVYDKCLSLASNPARDVNHPSCQQVLRNPVNGFAQATDVTYTNSAYAKTSGVDVQFNWGGELSGLPGYLSVNVLLNSLLEFETQAAPTEPVVDWKGTLGPSATTSLNGGAFDYRIFTSVNYAINDLAFSLRWRHLPDAEDESAAINSGPIPNLGAEDSYNIFDFSANWNFSDSYSVRVGIDNMLDEDPVITGAQTDLNGTVPTSGAGTTREGFYDTLGRRYYVGFKANF